MKLCKYLLAVLLLFSVLTKASAAEQGSITVHAGSGGTVTLYQIKDPEFSGCDISPTPEAARALADHAKTLPGKIQTPNAEGIVCFPELEEGALSAGPAQGRGGAAALFPLPGQHPHGHRRYYGV